MVTIIWGCFGQDLVGDKYISTHSVMAHKWSRDIILYESKSQETKCHSSTQKGASNISLILDWGLITLKLTLVDLEKANTSWLTNLFVFNQKAEVHASDRVFGNENWKRQHNLMKF